MSHTCKRCGGPVMYVKKDGDTSGKIFVLDAAASHVFATAGKSGDAVAYPLNSYGHAPHRCGDPEAVKEINAVLRTELAKWMNELSKLDPMSQLETGSVLAQFRRLLSP